MAWDDIPDWSSKVADVLLKNVMMKDPFTFYHCCRVGRAARRLAQAAGFNEYDQHRLEFSGLFHDIGKVGIPDNILLKPGSLTQQEFETMKSHALKSAEILEPLNHIPFFKSLLPGIRSHHERIDGKGYPYNLEGDKIPLTARIITIVDTVDAMMNTRPYRKGLSFDIVKSELQQFSGQQFDAHLVTIYLDAIRFWKSDQESDKEEMVIGQIMKKSA